jgi:hypothetical protein
MNKHFYYIPPLEMLGAGWCAYDCKLTYTLGVLEVCLYKLSLTQYDLCFLWLKQACRDLL